MRSCTHHGLQPLSNYYTAQVKNAYGRSHTQYKCKLCKKDYDASKPKSKKQNNFALKTRRQALHIEVLRVYSPNMRCAECGESHLEFLAMDHINGGGRPHVASIGNLYAWLKRTGFPEGFRVLCHNCNLKIGTKSQPIRPMKPLTECMDSYLRTRKRWERHPEKAESHKAKKRASYKANKLLIFTHYGAKCLCCGITDVDVLSLDHTNGKGNAHRRSIGVRGSGFYSWVIKNKFPRTLRVLCLNCNKARGAYGKCPHEIKSFSR
jgi:hypothetical protein